jgi:hypothetical protein
VLHFPPRERAEQIRFQHLIIGVPPRYRTHSSTPLLDCALWKIHRRWRSICNYNTRSGRQIPERKLTCIQRFTLFGARLNASQRNLSRIRRRGNCGRAALQ